LAVFVRGEKRGSVGRIGSDKKKRSVFFPGGGILFSATEEGGREERLVQWGKRTVFGSWGK